MQKKTIIELGLTSVLIIVLLFVVANATRKARQIKRPKAKAKTKLTPPRIPHQAAKGQDKGLYQILEEESKSLKLPRDPFAPPPKSPAEVYLSDLHLSGIAWDEASPRAIINDVIVGIGDKVGVSRIVDITQDKVTLSDGIHQFEIRLGQ